MATEDTLNQMSDLFDNEPDARIKSTGGYTKIQDGDSIKLRVTANFYKYYTFKEEGERMPMMGAEVRDLLDNRTLEDLFEDNTISISERYAAIVWNYTTNQPEAWQMSRRLFEQLRSLHRDSDWTGLWENDVKVTRSGSGTETTYSVNYTPKSEKLDPKQEAELLSIDVPKMIAGAERIK